MGERDLLGIDCAQCIHGLDSDFELLGHNGIVGVWGGGGCIEICHIVLALHCCLINSVPIASYISSAE